MVWIGLGVVILGRFFYEATTLGRTAKRIARGAKAADARVLQDTTRLLHKKLRQGFNPYEEAFHQKHFGFKSPLLPARVLAKHLPEGFEEAVKAKVTGDFLWKVTEWNSFRLWATIKIRASHGDRSILEGEDGIWLAEKGRRRWADIELRKLAFDNATKMEKVWRESGMWPEEKLISVR